RHRAGVTGYRTPDRLSAGDVPDPKRLVGAAGHCDRLSVQPGRGDAGNPTRVAEERFAERRAGSEIPAANAEVGRGEGEWSIVSQRDGGQTADRSGMPRDDLTDTPLPTAPARSPQLAATHPTEVEDQRVRVGRRLFEVRAVGDPAPGVDGR